MTPHLFVLAGRDAGRSFAVHDGAVLGRAPDCDVRLHDRSVSRHHARVEGGEAGWFLVDTGSRNGLRKDGERLERVPLGDHDEVLLGELPLRFRLALEAGGKTQAPSAHTPPARNAGPARPSRAPAPAARAAAPDEVVLEEEIELGETVRTPTPEPPRTALSTRDRERAQILGTGATGGLLGGDLAQRPLWVRFLVAALALGVGAGMLWAAFQVVARLRAGP